MLLIPAKNDPLRFRARLVQALKAEGLPFLDLEHAALGPEDYFAGDDHWNVSGHAKVARLLVPFLETVAAVGMSPSGSMRSVDLSRRVGSAGRDFPGAGPPFAVCVRTHPPELPELVPRAATRAGAIVSHHSPLRGNRGW